MERIFYWVQENIRYIAFEDGIMGYKPANSDKVCSMRYGDCKGMANLTKQLLILKGFDARLTWIGTNDIPYDHKYPTLATYNHMICTVFLNGKKYFLDPTETYISLGDYAERIQGKEVMIENGKTFLIDRVPQMGFERNIVNETSTISASELTLNGKSKLTLNGEEKTVFLQRLADLKTENIELAVMQYLKSHNSSLNILKYSSSFLENRSTEISINYEYLLRNAIFKSGQDLLILPEKDFEFEETILDTLRLVDFQFHCQSLLSSSTEITIPQGYVVKKTPNPINIIEQNFEFKLEYIANGNKIIYSKELKIKNDLLKTNEFKHWNNCVNKLKFFYHEPVILKKI